MTKRQSRLFGRVTLGSLAASLLAAGSAQAGGLYLPGSGPVSVARAGASVASLSDPSAIGVNPAGLAGTKGTVVHVGSSLVSFNMTFQRYGVHEDVPGRTDPWEGQPYAAVSDDSKPAIGIGQFQAVPTIAIATDLSSLVKGLALGVGIYAPTAYPARRMGADYTLEDPTRPPPPTRYDVIEQTAAVVLPSIALAYRPIPKLDIGARFSSGFADIDATTYVWGLSNFEEWAGKDAKFHVKVKDLFVPAFGLGARYRVTPAIEVGAAWSSAIEVRADGIGDAVQGSGVELGPGQRPTIIPIEDSAAQCNKGGTAAELKACVNLNLAATVTVGGRYIVRDAAGKQMADVEANVAWEQWSSATDQEVIVDGFASLDGTTNAGVPLNKTIIRHGFKDTYSFRLGGSYERDMGPGRVTVRGGVAYDTTAAKTGWERADLDGAARTTMALGGSMTLDKVRIDIGGGMVYEGTRTQDAGCNNNTQGANCTGPGLVPPDKRTGPDPIQPVAAPGSQQISPINQGAISSGYKLLMIGVTTWV
ncbi:MAG: outer membrane protein transport protein [Myxococcales bacterium]|nr:outer membrane protein transport protein [Myxococcales bacterium]